jgi:hypothetical protein
MLGNFFKAKPVYLCGAVRPLFGIVIAVENPFFRQLSCGRNLYEHRRGGEDGARRVNPAVSKSRKATIATMTFLPAGH